MMPSYKISHLGKKDFPVILLFPFFPEISMAAAGLPGIFKGGCTIISNKLNQNHEYPCYFT